uniref:Uncharacterized protein n=1 Tax=Quercus lobata TaxID=97700 RepID=A0A7N2LYJ2_QUELO
MIACLDLLQLLSVNTNKIGWGELFLSFWAAKMTKAVLSDSLEASLKFPLKLLSHEEELHDGVEAVDAIATPKATHTH